MPAQPPGAYGALSASASSPDQPATLYVATQLGVMRSVDGARTWHRKDIGLPEGDRSVRAILAVPGNPHEWYAATGNGLYRSTDNGVTWAQVALQGQDLYAPLAASSSGPLRVYTLSSRGEVHRLEGATLMR